MNFVKKEKFVRSVSLLSYAFNEEESISEFLEKAIQLMDTTVTDYEIVLVDDGSTDRTNEIVLAFQEQHPQLKIFQNRQNMGLGYSHKKAIEKASKEFLFWQTIDWSYEISRLREFLDYLNTYDIVLGVRHISNNEGNPDIRMFTEIVNVFSPRSLTGRSDNLFKGIISSINYFLIKVLFRVPLSDFQNVTFYPTMWIQSLKLEGNSTFANPEGLIKSYWAGKVIKEVPINFIARKKGKAKGTRPKAILSAVKDILYSWFYLVVLGRRGKINKGRIVQVDSQEN